MKCECGKRFYVQGSRMGKYKGERILARYYVCGNGHRVKTFEFRVEELDALLSNEVVHRVEELRSRVMSAL